MVDVHDVHGLSRPKISKTIVIENWNDPNELKQWAMRISRRRRKVLESFGWKPVKFNGEKHHADFLINAFDLILSNVRKGPGNYYVYLHCNPLRPLQIRDNAKHLILAIRYPFLTHEPFYVGKGMGNRYLDFNRNDSHRKIRQKIIKNNSEIIPIKIADDLSEEHAFDLESNIIDILGLRCYSQYGLLCNLDEGQDAKLRRSSYEDEMVKKILKKNGF